LTRCGVDGPEHEGVEAVRDETGERFNPPVGGPASGSPARYPTGSDARAGAGLSPTTIPCLVVRLGVALAAVAGGVNPRQPIEQCDELRELGLVIRAT
jgi:hypothetical protein